MTSLSSETLHASCVAVAGRGVLIEGLSGAGKSDLALRLIDRGAVLVSDDYTIVRRIDDHLVGAAPPNIAGMIEVRGLGLVAMPHATDVRIVMIVNLDTPVTRMPDPGASRVLAGVTVPVIAVPRFEASAPIKVELALKRLEIG